MILSRIFCSTYILCILHSNTYAQSPFDYGKTKDVYFISTKDIQNHKIDHIYTLTAEPEYGKWDFFDIDFTKLPARFYNKWSEGKDDNSRVPSLDSLILETADNYANASYYSFKNNRIEEAGMTGMGALCGSDYTFYKGYSIAEEGCKYGNETRQKKVVYFPNGRVNYTVCCKTLDLDNKVVEKKKDVFKDTTYYIYNTTGLVIGFKTKKLQAKVIPVFSNLLQQHSESYVETFINSTPFEQYIDQLIAYRPKLLLFEIYKNAVLPFKYDSISKRYVEMKDIHLE